MSPDPLSDVLSLLKPHTHVAGGLDLGGAWSIQFERHVGIKCYAVVSGAAWLAVEGDSRPLRLEAGHCVLLPSGRRFVLAEDLAAPSIPFSQLSPTAWDGGVATLNGGGDVLILGGHFDFSGAQTEILLGAMPTIVSLQDEADKAGLRWALDRMRQELFGSRPGGRLVVQHLAHLMLVQALRLYLAHGEGRGVGWLFALGDPRIGPAIRAVHADPGARWSLSDLAAEAGMSRSRFALRFKAVCGFSPMDYLTRWRMALAADRLSTGGETVSEVAFELGYDSAAAFSTAFKRVMGCAPRTYAARP